jgi:hypothetical protein
MNSEVLAYRKHINLKLAAAELGIAWQTLYVRLKRLGEPVTGDKLRYGTDRDRLGALGEAEFHRLVPFAQSGNDAVWQAKVDFVVAGWPVDVKASRPRQLNKRYPAKSWAFSFKKQSLVCDFICCFCMDDDRTVVHVLLVPSEFFAGLQTVSVSCNGWSKWLDYQIEPDQLAPFFKALGQKP